MAIEPFNHIKRPNVRHHSLIVGFINKKLITVFCINCVYIHVYIHPLKSFD